MFSHRARRGHLYTTQAAGERRRRWICALIDCRVGTISRFSLTLKRMFWLRVPDPRLFNSVNLNFLRTEALSFYKVPFVVCFCIRLLLSQDRLPFVQCSGGTFSCRPPPSRSSTQPRPPLRAPTPPNPVFTSAHTNDPGGPVPSRKGHNSGRRPDITTQETTSLRDPSPRGGTGASFQRTRPL